MPGVLFMAALTKLYVYASEQKNKQNHQKRQRISKLYMFLVWK